MMTAKMTALLNELKARQAEATEEGNKVFLECRKEEYRTATALNRLGLIEVGKLEMGYFEISLKAKA